MLKNVSRFWKSLNREQKLSVGLLSVCSFVALTLGAIQMRRNIIYPFTAPVDQLVTIKNLFGPSDAEKIAQSKKTDTDGDGLSDWDEENVYLTSKYLADTDSDGVLDNIELAKRTDPNCPTGQNCGYIYTPITTSGIGGEIRTPSTQQTSGNASQSTPVRDPVAIRAYLKVQGVPDAQLGSYTDAMLLQAYDQSMADVNASSSTASGISSTSTTVLTPTTVQESEYSQ